VAVPLVSSVQGNGTPTAGDQANAVVSGALTAIGTTPPFSFYGSFNILIWGSVATTLTTTAGSTGATVGSATGLAVGQTINCSSVPPGTIIAGLSGTSVTLGVPPTSSTAAIAAGSGAAATFQSVAVAASVQVERSFDGGATWLVCGVGGSGSLAQYVNPAVVSIVAGEPERQVAYRLNCYAYTSGTINYRISATGILATTFGIQPQ
jgi:hypothetical protein